MKNSIGLQAVFWSFSQGWDTNCEKCKYGPRTFAEKSALARLGTLRLPVLPVIDTKPGSAGPLKARLPVCNANGRAKPQNGRDGNCLYRTEFKCLPFEFFFEEPHRANP